MFIGVYSQSQRRARDGERKFELNEVKVALEQYHADSQFYPRVANFVALTTALVAARDLKVVPQDPSMPGGTDYYYIPLLSDGNTQCGAAQQDIQCQDYILCAKLENTNDADITGSPPRYPCLLQGGVAPPVSSPRNFGYRAP